MTKSARFRTAVVLAAALLVAVCIAGYKAYSAFYNQILERSDTWHLKVEEASGTSPLRLRITVDPNQGYMVIREVTTRRSGRDLNVLYHLALVGLAKPKQDWGKAYTLTVPDSVLSVSFGDASEPIWRRSH
jgi:hypothetical protein